MKQEQQPLSRDLLIEFGRELAMLLRAGFPAEQGVFLLLEERRTPGLEKLYDELERSGSLYASLEAVGGCPEYYVRMVRLGEEAGRLDTVLEELSDHYEREQALRQTLRSAITYPAVIITMMAVVLTILLTRVMPVIDRVFAQLGTRLSGLARIWLRMGEALRGNFIALAVLAAFITVSLLLARKYKDQTLTLARRIPWAGRLLDEFALCRFAGALSLGISSGLSVPYALELAAQQNTDAAFGRRIDQVRTRCDEGEELVEALKNSGILTGPACRLALVGQRTGQLDKALADIAAEARQSADRRVDTALSMLEPTLVVVLSILVGSVLLSVLLPMLSILSSL